jgi:hypothetical protein
MIDDFTRLGITATDDLTLIKKAFRAKMKALHPDTAPQGGSLKNHVLLIETCQAYDRIMGKQMAPEPPKTFTTPPGTGTVGTLARHTDPAYVFYKTGMKYFMKIHPSAWNIETHRRLNTKIPGHNTEQEKIKQTVKQLSALFPKAYYYFKLVFYEYSGSPWARDAAEKMRKIEERTLRYKRIIESFS